MKKTKNKHKKMMFEKNTYPSIPSKGTKKNKKKHSKMLTSVTSNELKNMFSTTKL